MKTSTSLVFIFVALAAVLSQSLFAEPAHQTKSAATHHSMAGSTQSNLQTAHYTEQYESGLYREFAKKADEEGYGQIASMFRAIARAEEIHAVGKEALIRQLGEVPQASSEPFAVRSTRENLEFAKASEAYESEQMYAHAIAQARSEKNKAAEQAFHLAQATEPGHQALFQQALDNLDGYRGENVEFLVCPQCGTTVRSLKGPACPSCSTPRDQFEKIR